MLYQAHTKNEQATSDGKASKLKDRKFRSLRQVRKP